MIPRYISLSVLFFSLHFLQAQKTIRGFEAPESVIKYEGKLYVSNIGGEKPNPMALDSNGFISELSAEGKMIRKKFSRSILNGPKGLAVAGNALLLRILTVLWGSISVRATRYSNCLSRGLLCSTICVP